MGDPAQPVDSLNDDFRALTGHTPLSWQARLYREHFAHGDIPAALDIPTGLGKTSVMALWLIARARSAPVPRRLVYVVDRRTVVDQATEEAEKLRNAFEVTAQHFDALADSTQAKATAAALKDLLGFDNKRTLPISTLRGAHVGNRDWLDDPAAPAIIVGTVDMIGSRLLFEGYGVSRKMRPYHAGFLGVDALIVLDEAHLVPPFTHLLRSIERDAQLWPGDEADRNLLPRFAVLPLSATQRVDKHDRASFRLEEADKSDATVARRLGAPKRLRLEALAAHDQDKQLAEAAWALATKHDAFARVVVFCDRREKKDDGGGPSAQGVAEAIETLANGDKKAGRGKVAIHPVELLVGARRVRERDGAAKRLRALGFIGEKQPLERPAFLVATAAGEVGVDVDADHMVSDLVSWERTVQRLGRVNRRGEGDADVVVFCHDAPSPRKENEPTPAEKRALTAFNARAVIERLRAIDGGFDASPGALRDLAERADDAGKALIEAATTPEPLRPALSRALVDAWSMTSLEHHTGRPEIAPWLRGWVEEDRPQTTIVWRKHLPVRDGDAEWPRTAAEKKEVEDFFEAAPPHESEKLETETFRVVAWLEARAAVKGSRATVVGEDVELDEIDPELDDAAPAERADAGEIVSPSASVGIDSIVAIALSPRGDFEKAYSLRKLTQTRDSNARKHFEADFRGMTLVVDARLDGLDGKGMLDPSVSSMARSADADDPWSSAAEFRVRRATSWAAEDAIWRFEDDFVLRRNEDGQVAEWLVIEHLRAAAQGENARAISKKAQELAEHQGWAQQEAECIVSSIGLRGDAALALALAARLHDEGKRAASWQRAFNAPRAKDARGEYRVFAKTRGPFLKNVLGGYRHEFGSLPYAEGDHAVSALPPDDRDLVLHLIAAHHGGARPVIGTEGCTDGPPSVLEARAREVALRFARLQKRWGPWGLAWLEALMRAADQRASRRLETRDDG